MVEEVATIVTPLKVDAWVAAFKELAIDSFDDVIHGIRHGFLLSTDFSNPTTTIIHPNHRSALDRPDVIEAYIINELSFGRYLGPYSIPALEAIIGPFRASPLGTVPKGSSGDFRIIQDFSYPHDNPLLASVNSEINSDDFPCGWGTFEDAASLFTSLPTDAEAATFDVDAAFRCIPIHPSHRRHTVIVWKGLAYMDTSLAFGTSSSGGIFGRVADAMLEILHRRKIGPGLHWVDDYIISRSPQPHHLPPTFAYDTLEIYNVGNEVGFPFKESKTRPFSSLPRYIGFDWSIPDRTVHIPLEKRLKYKTRVDAILATGRASLKEMECTHGSLIHCALVSIEGRSHLPTLSSFTASFSYLRNPAFAIRKIPSGVAADLTWWSVALTTDIHRSFAPPPPPVDLDFWTDASTSVGIGVIVDREWDGWALRHGWKSEGRDIG